MLDHMRTAVITSLKITTDLINTVIGFPVLQSLSDSLIRNFAVILSIRINLHLNQTELVFCKLILGISVFSISSG